MNWPTDLQHLAFQLDQLAEECVRLGVPASTTSRVIDARRVIPIIEQARDRES